MVCKEVHILEWEEERCDEEIVVVRHMAIKKMAI